MHSDPKQATSPRVPYLPLSIALIAAGLWARCVNFRSVFTADGVLLKPTDSHYYVRFAQLQWEHLPRFVHFDPWVNFPDGAEIYWPPVHTWWVALHALFTRANPEAGAAWAGVTASAVWLVVSAVATRRVLGPRIALWTLTGLALLPAMIESSVLGNCDHHVHEPYLALMLALAIVALAKAAMTHVAHASSGDRAADPRELGAAVWLGVIVAGSRLLTTGTVVLLPCAGAALVACALLDRASCLRLARAALAAGGVASTLSAALALLFGNLSSLELVQLSAFLPLASVAVFGGAAAVLALRGGDRRFAAGVAVSALVCGAVIARSILIARDQFAGGDPLLKVVVESQPLWRIPSAWRGLLGPAAVLFPVALVGAIARALRPRDPVAIVFAAISLVLTAGFFAQLRFVQPLAGPLAATLPVGLIALLEPAARNIRRASAG